MASLNWRGEEVKAKARRAARLAIDATMSACVIHAKAAHGPGARGGGRFESHSGELERGTRIVQNARDGRGGPVGRWGVVGVVYGRRIELGFQGRDAAGRVFDAPAYPFLRPAAQAEYPKFAGRVRRAFQIA